MTPEDESSGRAERPYQTAARTRLPGGTVGFSADVRAAVWRGLLNPHPIEHDPDAVTLVRAPSLGFARRGLVQDGDDLCPEAGARVGLTEPLTD